MSVNAPPDAMVVNLMAFVINGWGAARDLLMLFQYCVLCAKILLMVMKIACQALIY